MDDLSNSSATVAPSIGAADARQRRTQHYFNLLISSLRENALLIGITVIYYLLSAAVENRHALRVSSLDDIGTTYITVWIGLALSGFCAFAIWFIYWKRVKQQPDFASFVRRRLRGDYFSPSSVILALPLLLVWPIFVSTFSYFKALIPVFRPFLWDAYLADWDRRLHLGKLPSTWLEPIFGHAGPMFILNWLYTMWFIVMMTALLLQAANTRNRPLRAQYLLAQAILWPVLGNLAATFLSSAGPCYFGRITPEINPYAEHMTRLMAISSSLEFSFFGTVIHMPLTALSMQTYLWNGYVAGNFEVGLGISAAPSMHVASTWLVARLCWAYGRKAGLVGFCFLALIFIGSIELGWHYAIDGYLGILGAWLCWRLAGLILSLRPVKRLLWGASQEADPAGLTAG